MENNINDIIEDWAAFLAKEYNIDFEKYKPGKTIRIDQEYQKHKDFVSIQNLISSNNHIYALPTIDELFNYHIRSFTKYVATDGDVDKLVEVSQLITLYQQEFKPFFDKVKQSAEFDLQKGAEYNDILLKFDKFFNIYDLYHVKLEEEHHDKLTLRIDTNLFLVNDLEPLVKYLLLERSKLKDRQVLVVSAIRRDQLDSNFSAFHFFVVTNKTLHSINTELNFQSFNKKLFTRRPERMRESEYDKLPLPHDVIFHPEKYLPKQSQSNALTIFVDKEFDKESMFKFHWPDFDDCWEFFQYMSRWAIMNKIVNRDFENVQYQFSKTLHTKLLESKEPQQIENYLNNPAAQLVIDDLIKHQLPELPSSELTTIETTEELLNSSPLAKDNLLMTADQYAGMIKWIARHKQVGNLIEQIQKTKTRRKLDEAQEFFKDIYNRNRKQILDRIFAANETFVNRQNIRFMTVTFDRTATKPYLISEPARIVWVNENEYRDRIQYPFPIMSFATTLDWGGSRSDHPCHWCQETGCKVNTANNSVYVELQHYRELMWLFGIQDRMQLPETFRSWSGNHYKMYFGNSILQDVDPIHRIYEYERQRFVSDQQSRDRMILHFAICKRCMNRIRKNRPQQHVHQIDYQLIDPTLIHGDNKQWNIDVEVFNANLSEHHQHHKLRKVNDPDNNEYHEQIDI